jgi:hypothetical protein
LSHREERTSQLDFLRVRSCEALRQALPAAACWKQKMLNDVKKKKETRQQSKQSAICTDGGEGPRPTPPRPRPPATHVPIKFAELPRASKNQRKTRAKTISKRPRTLKVKKTTMCKVKTKTTRPSPAAPIKSFPFALTSGRAKTSTRSNSQILQNTAPSSRDPVVVRFGVYDFGVGSVSFRLSFVRSFPRCVDSALTVSV